MSMHTGQLNGTLSFAHDAERFRLALAEYGIAITDEAGCLANAMSFR